MIPNWRVSRLNKAFFRLILLLATVSLCFSFQAKKTFNYKLIVFEGSDWCPNCISFEKNILSDTVFAAFLENNLIKIEKIDFPQRKKLSKEQIKYNASVAEKFSFDGSYPTVLLINATSEKYLKLNYSNQTTNELINEIELKMEKLK